MYQVGQGRGKPAKTDIILMLVTINQFLEELEILGLHSFSNLFFEQVYTAIGNVLATRQAHGGNRLTGCPLNRCQHPPLPGGDKEDSLPFTAGTASTADAVDIGFGVVGDVIIDDMADTLDVQTACSHIGCHDNIQRPVLQFLDGGLPR